MTASINLSEIIIEIGTPLLLYIPSRKWSFKGVVVGFKPGENIVFEVPGGSGIGTGILAGSIIHGAFISSGTLVRFKSSVLQYIKHPARHVIASFPEVVDCRELRQSKRTDCQIAAVLKLYSNMSEISGTILDISSGGCKYRMDYLPAIHGKYTPGTEFCLVFELPGTKAKHTMDGKILHVERKGPHVFLGLKFTEAQEERSKVDEWLSQMLALPSE
jgi:hypothetical protein